MSLQPAVVRAVLEMPTAQPCQSCTGLPACETPTYWKQNTFSAAFLFVPFQKAGLEQSHTNGAQPWHKSVRQGGEQENQIWLWRNGKWKQSPVIADNSAVRECGCRKQQAWWFFFCSLLATHLSREPKGMGHYRLPVIYETVTIIVAVISKKN